MFQNNQNNIFINGSLISGISAAITGNPVAVRGITKYSLCLEGLNDSGVAINKTSATGIIQAILHPNQTSWVTLFSTGFNNVSTGVLFQINTPLEAIRVVVNPYSSGIVNCWFAATQN